MFYDPVCSHTQTAFVCIFYYKIHPTFLGWFFARFTGEFASNLLYNCSRLNSIQHLHIETKEGNNSCFLCYDNTPRFSYTFINNMCNSVCCSNANCNYFHLKKNTFFLWHLKKKLFTAVIFKKIQSFIQICYWQMCKKCSKRYWIKKKNT